MIKVLYQKPKPKAKQPPMVLGTGLEDRRRQELAEKMQILHDRMKDVRTNIAWKKKLDGKKPPAPPPVAPIHMGARFPEGVVVDPNFDVARAGGPNLHGPGVPRENRVDANLRVEKPRVIERHGYPTLAQCKAEITELEKEAGNNKVSSKSVPNNIFMGSIEIIYIIH